MTRHLFRLRGAELVILLAAGCGAGSQSPGGKPPSQAYSTTAPAQACIPPAVEALQMDAVMSVLLPGYEQQERRLSEVGIGYHYVYKAIESGKRLAITVGVFASGANAHDAAVLSHSLMPMAPRGVEALADEAWIWEQGNHAAVRFRLGRLLCRAGGEMSAPEVIELARKMVRHFAAKLPSLSRDVEDWLSADSWSGVPARMRPSESVQIRASLGPDSQKEKLEAGVWSSAGQVTREADNVFRFTAPRQPGRVRIRCFATSEFNRVAVSTHIVEIRGD